MSEDWEGWSFHHLSVPSFQCIDVSLFLCFSVSLVAQMISSWGSAGLLRFDAATEGATSSHIYLGLPADLQEGQPHTFPGLLLPIWPGYGF
jgi:hypothetical protein